MKKRILKTLLLTTTLISLFTIGASAEWRQTDKDVWIYYDTNNTQLKDCWVDSDYYVDSNGLWIKDTKETEAIYCAIQYDKNTGVIWGKGSCLGANPVTQVTREYGTQTFDLLYVKHSEFEQGLNVFENYHVINDNGTWKIERINNINTSK